ncbi:hypothetical protein OAA26_00300 [bacterium]|nr:hypothetical protein [bacterium]
MVNGLLAKNGIIVTGSVEVQNAVTASAFSGDGSALTGITTDISALNTFTSSIQSQVNTLETSTGSYATTSSVDILVAATSSYLTSIPSTYLNTTTYTTETISKNFNYTSSLNVAEITSSVESVIMDYRVTNLSSGSRAGTFIYTHNGTDLNYVDSTVEGVGNGNNPILSATLTGSIVSLDIENAAGFNFSGFAKKFSKLDNAVLVADPNVSYLLDAYPSEDYAVAYSLRQLSQFYTGSAIRVREDGTNTETDIDFDVNGNLDTVAISTHCGANNGYVTIWYDQSGNGNNAVQTTVSRQPQIYNGTAVITENGKPTIKFNGSTTQLDFNATHNTSYYYSVFAVRQGTSGMFIGSPDTNRYYADYGDGGSSYVLQQGFQRDHVVNPSQDDYEIYRKNGVTAFTAPTTRTEYKTAFYDGNQVLMSFLTDGNPGAISFTSLRLGSYLSGLHYNGNVQEFIMHQSLTSNQSSNASNIETNINNYYGIYDTGLLEDYSDAQFAFSVRQLTTAATSSIEIRRASDNTETTIGFTSNGDLDTGSIETFCNGTECVIVKWYDQTGNNRDATQTNTLFQPTIYSGSTVITFNGIPAATNAYYNYDDKFTITNTLGVPDSGSFTVSYVNNFYAAGGTSFTHISSIGDRTNRLITYMPGYAGIDGTYTRSPDHADHSIIYRKSGSEANIQGAYHNGSFTSENGLNGQAAYNPSTWQLPSQTPTYMHEIIFWPSNLSGSGATDVMDNVNSYFNIY